MDILLLLSLPIFKSSLFDGGRHNTNSTMPSSDEIVALNNYLQDRNMLASLSWSFQATGVGHEPQWTARCRINGVTRGTGAAGKKTLAKRQAAGAALRSLQEENEGE
ncbi:hypothetical protein PLEOSDRAFT_155949 [Pleurotus ostreatus PC15]|uniref:DRBM domain-containing protein n=1 Tax=Pleurotus ostreatus (strain PC15) TaxID=1137138 RepID=A0A067NT80_PLEO1|nr:hypothetical protein PLEOSDRAFT_155949 [Pleurotus ostreatus PC15]